MNSAKDVSGGGGAAVRTGADGAVFAGVEAGGAEYTGGVEALAGVEGLEGEEGVDGEEGFDGEETIGGDDGLDGEEDLGGAVCPVWPSPMHAKLMELHILGWRTGPSRVQFMST